jgi:hypothetical protein
MEFKSFKKIEHFDKLQMIITQKIHGSNAQVVITENDILCGSRNRWLTPDDDNFGFAKFVHDNKEEFISKLGVGTHYGEWAGPGINSGEGLTEKTFILFDYWKFSDVALPPNCRVVPVLYKGKLNLDKIDEVMEDLRVNGSKLVPGFMKPEGVVITLNGGLFKKVFEPETTQWQGKPKVKFKKDRSDKFDHLLQPIRLEKLLSKDEQLVLNFPDSLIEITNLYFTDLVDEKELLVEDLKEARKSIGSDLFNLIKQTVKNL